MSSEQKQDHPEQQEQQARRKAKAKEVVVDINAIVAQLDAHVNRKLAAVESAVADTIHECVTNPVVAGVIVEAILSSDDASRRLFEHGLSSSAKYRATLPFVVVGRLARRAFSWRGDTQPVPEQVPA